jgi:hypothetical protein
LALPPWAAIAIGDATKIVAKVRVSAISTFHCPGIINNPMPGYLALLTGLFE